MPRNLRRILPFAATAAVVAATWAAWWLWPPAPEMRWRVPGNNDRARIAPGGNTVLVESPDPGQPEDAQSLRVDAWEPATGRKRGEFPCRAGADGQVTYRFSDDGSRLAYRDGSNRWQIRRLPGCEPVASLPITVSGFVHWSSDGSRLIVLDLEAGGRDVYQADDGVFLGKLERCERRAMLPDGSGFVELSADSRFLIVYLWPADGVAAAAPERTDATQPAAGMGRIRHLLSTPNSGVVVAIADRIEADGDKLVNGSYALRLDRLAGRVTECPVDGDPRRFGFGLSADGRLLAHGHVFAKAWRNPAWWDQLPRTGRGSGSLFDLASDPPRCLNTDELPVAMTYQFDPTARRILMTDGLRVTVVDATSRRSVGQTAAKEYLSPRFDPAGRWALDATEHWWSEWAPAYVQSLARSMFQLSESRLCVVRLSDGQLCRELPDRGPAGFTDDGHLWTLTQTPAGVFAERWLPEAPGPPWWLWGVTAGGVGVLAWVRAIASAGAPC